MINTPLPYTLNPNLTGAVPAVMSAGTMFYSTTSNFIGVNNHNVGMTLSNSVNSHKTLHVHGNAEFENDIIIKGKSLAGTLDDIQKKLLILSPDPKKLAKWEALKKAYDRYKILEALLDEDDDGK